MNILFVTGGFPTADKPHRGIFNERAVRSLRKFADVRVCLFRYWKPGRKFVHVEDHDGMELIILSLPWAPINNAWVEAFQHKIWARLAGYLLSKTLKAWSPQIVHSVNLEMGPVGASVSKKFGASHFSQATGSDLYFYIPRISRYWPEKGHWRHSIKAVVCNSHHLRKSLDEVLPGLKGEVVYRGIDLKRFFFNPRFKAGANTFLFLGGFSERKGSGLGRDLKGGDFLISLWEELDRDDNFTGNLKLCGPLSKAEFIQDWQNGLRRPERVACLGDINPGDIPELIRSADVLLLPSRSEGLPNVAMEAMASGVLVIASNVGGVPELVLNSKTGILIEPTDTDSWLRAIRNANENFGLYGDIINQARTYLEENFNSAYYGENLMDLYKKYS